MKKRFFLAVLLWGGGLGAGYAQTFRADVRQVYLPVRVFKNGQAVRGLTLHNFRIWEEVKNSRGEGEEVEQTLEESIPYKSPRLALATAIDNSGSMGSKSAITGESKREDAKAACRILFLSVFRPGYDQGLVLEFAFESWYAVDKISGLTVVVSNRFYINQNWTSDGEKLEEGLGRIEISAGGTPLRDAIFSLANLFQRADPTALRIAVVLTDGEDDRGNLNEKTLSEVIDELQRNQVLAFAVGLFQKTDDDRNILQKVAEATGGEAFFEADISRLTDTFLRIGEMIRDVYFVSYVAKNEVAGPRKIRVEVGEWDKKGKWRKNKVQLFYRQGYAFQP